LFFLQLLNHALSLLTASMLRIDTPAALAQTGATLLPTIALGSAASACSIRWTGRELLQRRSAVERTMGRILLACALCEPAALEQRASANAARLRETDQLRQRGVRRGPRARWTKAAAEQLGRPLLLLFIACVFGSLALSVFAVQALATQLLLERVLRAGERRARAALAEAPAASSAGAAGGG
jgi:hypothetical protein